MCKECGCSTSSSSQKSDKEGHSSSSQQKTVEVFTKILAENNKQAQENRTHLDENGIFCINLMSSPGAGKTTLLEKTIDILKEKLRIGVIEADLETDRDAQRIKSKGIPAYQINTGQTCHIDAFMVHHALHNLPLHSLDIVFIENVGNLVCPACYDIGSHINAVLLSVPEGDDKPAKYPVIFRVADILLLTKIDLLPYLTFHTEKVIQEARNINPKMDIIKLSSLTGEGMKQWSEYLCLKKTLRVA